MRRQKPWVSSVPPAPTWGIVSKPGDQNALRPKIASSAGSTVSIEIIASPTPIAPTGPRPAVELTSAMLSVSSAAITVSPEARIAGPRCAARSRRFVLVLVAAQLLAVARHEQQRVVRPGAEDEHRQDAAGLPVDRHPASARR